MLYLRGVSDPGLYAQQANNKRFIHDDLYAAVAALREECGLGHPPPEG
jgi:hypothetical protein